MPRTYVITITTDFPDADSSVIEAATKLACEVDWGDDYTTSIEVIEKNLGYRYIAGWEMEPGEGLDTDHDPN